MRRVLLVIAAALLLTPAHASAPAVRGVVLEDATSRPIAGALVEVFVRGNILTNARTDSAGGFLMFPRRSGLLTVRVTHAFYSALDSVSLDLGPGETVTVQLRLGQRAVPLQPLVVTGRMEARLADFQERRRRAGGFGQFLVRSDFEHRTGAQTTDLLRELTGVEIITVGRGGTDQPTPIGTPDVTTPRTRVITMRSIKGACVPAIYVDGYAVKQFNDSGVDDFLKPDMLEGVEVYPGSVGAPAEFVDPTMCGVVAFWTRAGLGEGRRWSWARVAAGTAAFAVLVALTR